MVVQEETRLCRRGLLLGPGGSPNPSTWPGFYGKGFVMIQLIGIAADGFVVGLLLLGRT